MSYTLTPGTPIDPADFVLWLQEPTALPCVLIEVTVLNGGTPLTLYISSKGYVTLPTDTPANQHYAPLLVGTMQFTEDMTPGNTPSMSYGDIELANDNGEIDAWLDYVWVNRQVNIFFGDMTWARANFIQVFSGVAADISSKSRDRLDIILCDLSQNLNTTISSVTLGGTTANSTQLIPLLFGECFNISPLLTDPANLIYQVHNGSIESVIEVRDNGVPVPFVVNLVTGTFQVDATGTHAVSSSINPGCFQLLSAPVGTVTCSAQGDHPVGGTYASTIATITERLATGFGTTGLMFTSAMIDTAGMAAFDAANPMRVGVYLTNQATVLDTINALAASIGAYPIISRQGQLNLVQANLPIPSGITPTAVTTTDMYWQTLEVSDRSTTTTSGEQEGQNSGLFAAAVTIGYCQNWTVQTSLQTGIPPGDVVMYGQEYMLVNVQNGAAAAEYLQPLLVAEQDTQLLSTSDATNEANRRLNMFDVPRTTYTFDARPYLLLQQLGGYQTLVNDRFGMESGLTGQIINIVTDWLRPAVTFQVLI
jgi:hypothetical protein